VAVILYHNPRCGKSREALRLLEARGIEPVIVEYLKTPPSAAELRRILKLLGLEARGLLRTKEPDYKKAGLDDASLSEASIVAAMVAHPILIERPILLANGKAALGRPPENILRILRAR
jgi:arsenate reductase